MKKSNILIIIDRRGSVQIRGFEGEDEAVDTARKLGLSEHHRVLQAGDLAPEFIDQVVNRARILGFRIKERTGKGEVLDHVRPAAAHETAGGHGAGRLVVRGLTAIAVLAVLGGAGFLARDYLVHTYTPVPSVTAAMEMAVEPPVAAGGLTGFLDPPDDHYVSFVLGGFAEVDGTSGIAEGHYVRLHGLRDGSLSKLLGPRGTGILVFETDLWKSEPNRLHVDRILRDGIDMREAGVTLEIQPLETLAAADVYAAGDSIAFDRKETFEGLRRFTTRGRLEGSEGGMRVVNDRYAVALTGAVDPVLGRLIDERLLGDGTSRETLFYLTLVETYPWKDEDGSPGRRQEQREIGAAHLDGIRLGTVSLANTAP